jgi:hypothetical protein
MSNESRRVSELLVANTVSANDRVLALINPATAANTKTITLRNLANSMITSNVFPIANSTQLGVIKIGDGLSIAANGVVTAPLPVASNSVHGVVQIGDGLNVDENGVISVNSTNTGNFTFSNNILYTPSDAEISTAREANTPYSISYYGTNYWGAYSELDTPGGNNSWAWIETNNNDINEPFILHEVVSYNGNVATWRFYANGVLDLPFDIGDIQRNGVSLIGTGQIDGGNAFTTPTAEITVDGGGA